MNQVTQHMFYKQKIQLNPIIGALFPPEKAAEFLIRASAMSVSTGYEWVFVEKPTGTIFEF